MARAWFHGAMPCVQEHVDVRRPERVRQRAAGGAGPGVAAHRQGAGHRGACVAGRLQRVCGHQLRLLRRPRGAAARWRRRDTSSCPARRSVASSAARASSGSRAGTSPASSSAPRTPPSSLSSTSTSPCHTELIVLCSFRIEIMRTELSDLFI